MLVLAINQEDIIVMRDPVIIPLDFVLVARFLGCAHFALQALFHWA